MNITLLGKDIQSKLDFGNIVLWSWDEARENELPIHLWWLSLSWTKGPRCGHILEMTRFTFAFQ